MVGVGKFFEIWTHRAGSRNKSLRERERERKIQKERERENKIQRGRERERERENKIQREREQKVASEMQRLTKLLRKIQWCRYGSWGFTFFYLSWCAVLIDTSAKLKENKRPKKEAGPMKKQVNENQFEAVWPVCNYTLFPLLLMHLNSFHFLFMISTSFF